MQDGSTTGKPPLDPKLEAVLARLIRSLGPLYKMQAVKLPYVADVVALHFLGHRLTSGTFETWQWGVVTQEVFEALRTQGSILHVEPRVDADGFMVELSGEPSGSLTDAECAIVEAVAQAFGTLSPGLLERLTKNMNSEVRPEDWGRNLPARVDEEAFSRLSDQWQKISARLERVDLDDRKHWSPPVQDDPVKHFRQFLDAQAD